MFKASVAAKIKIDPENVRIQHSLRFNAADKQFPLPPTQRGGYDD
jgi:hypothetical protein